MANPKIVILCLENRSFDGYFGTRQDAKGFYDPDAIPGVFAQEGFSEGTVVNPFRASTFSSIRGSTFPNRMALMSGTIFSPASLEPANLDPAQLVDNVAIRTTAGNIPVVDNQYPPAYTYPWPCYPATIGTHMADGTVAAWTVYDETGWQPSWVEWNNPAPPAPALPSSPQLPAYLAFYGTSGQQPSSAAAWPPWAVNGNEQPNMMGAQASGVANYQLGTADDPNNTSFTFTNAFGEQHTGYYYTPTPSGAVPVDGEQSNFMADAQAGNLPDISWILPAYWLSAHPSYLSADADAYLARVVDAVVSSPHWAAEGVVLIITYDEANGSFDHVLPPSPLSDQLANYGPGGTIPANTIPPVPSLRAPPRRASS